MCVSLWDSNFFLLALVRADFTFPLVYLVFYRCRCQVIKMRIILGHLLKIHAFHYHLLSSGVRFFQHELQYTPGLLCSYSLCSTDFHFIFYIHFNSLQLCSACATFCSSHCCGSFSIRNISSPRANILWKADTPRGANKSEWYHHWAFQQIWSVDKCIPQCNTQFSEIRISLMSCSSPVTRKRFLIEIPRWKILYWKCFIYCGKSFIS